MGSGATGLLLFNLTFLLAMAQKVCVNSSCDIIYVANNSPHLFVFMFETGLRFSLCGGATLSNYLSAGANRPNFTAVLNALLIL